MDVQLTNDESAAVRTALRSYLSDLRMEIRDTDNPVYKRELRSEREALESAIAKLDRAAETASTADTGTVTVVELWWSAER